MKRLLLLGCLLAAAIAAAQVFGNFPPTLQTSPPFSETQACAANICARAANPASTAEGASAQNVRAYYYLVAAASGQTLSGSGTCTEWFCTSRTTPQCSPHTQNKYSITSTTQTQFIGPIIQAAVTTTADTLVLVCSGVGVSGGASITVTTLTAS